MSLDILFPNLCRTTKPGRTEPVHLFRYHRGFFNGQLTGEVDHGMKPPLVFTFRERYITRCVLGQYRTVDNPADTEQQLGHAMAKSCVDSYQCSS